MLTYAFNGGDNENENGADEHWCMVIKDDISNGDGNDDNVKANV